MTTIADFSERGMFTGLDKLLFLNSFWNAYHLPLGSYESYQDLDENMNDSVLDAEMWEQRFKGLPTCFARVPRHLSVEQVLEYLRNAYV